MGLTEDRSPFSAVAARVRELWRRRLPRQKFSDKTPNLVRR
jgi:hypothetical protein